MSKTRFCLRYCVCLWLGCWYPLLSAETFDPLALYLTWTKDPLTSMTVCWQTTTEAKPEVYVRKLQAQEWRQVEGASKAVPQISRTAHWACVENLEPGADYEFCFSPGEQAFRFRTMPDTLDKPLRFVTGGDVYHERSWVDQMNELAGKLDPSFVLLGGDLAYSCGGKDNPEKMESWKPFFESWKLKARTPDGRLIPLLAAIGNHEVVGGYGQNAENAAGYVTFFQNPGEKGYACMDFGSYLSLLLLDSGHIQPVAGAQTSWIETTLSARKSVPHKIPVYHVPAWPSFRPETGAISVQIRTNWCPLFERYGVRVAFENHDHANKRTHPLRDGKIDKEGVVYLGDGAWGVGLRQPDPNKPRWYLARAGSIRHLYLITLYPTSRHVVAVNERGEFFDDLYQTN